MGIDHENQGAEEEEEGRPASAKTPPAFQGFG